MSPFTPPPRGAAIVLNIFISCDFLYVCLFVCFGFAHLLKKKAWNDFKIYLIIQESNLQ